MKKNDIDIEENMLRKKNKLLDILLIDRTTKKNIIWATDSYKKLGKKFGVKMQILPSLVTGKYRLLIQPRVAKSLDEQRQRTKDKAEVFTPPEIVDRINKVVENYVVNKKSWQKYVREPKLEITCGEAPFIVSRYNPTSHNRKFIKLKDRVGFLDRKLKIVSTHCNKKNKWLFWAKEAFKASYGYEWQGDNILLARENLLYTFIDYYKYKFKKIPSLRLQENFAKIISWNIFQMDGLKYVLPMSCYEEVFPTTKSFLGYKKNNKKKCEGCVNSQPNKHNGKYVKIMDWEKGKSIRFLDIIS